MRNPSFSSADHLTADERDFGLGWYGYGRWEAPYWFIGMEPGGDEVDACMRAWDVLGREPLLDVQEGHQFHDVDLFSDDVRKAQATWEKLIWLMLAFEGRECTPEATLEYQKRNLARANPVLGVTSLIELSAFAVKDNTIASPRSVFREARAEYLKRRVREFTPRFVVMYGLGKHNEYLPWWSEIADVKLVPHRIMRVEDTLLCALYHPNKDRSKDYWTIFGGNLRKRADAIRERG